AAPDTLLDELVGAGAVRGTDQQAVEAPRTVLERFLPPRLEVGVGGALVVERVDRGVPPVPAPRDVPEVDHLGPSAGDAHRVEGALEDEVDLLVADRTRGVLHVGPGAQADDVDDLVQVEVFGVAHGAATTKAR